MVWFFNWFDANIDKFIEPPNLFSIIFTWRYLAYYITDNLLIFSVNKFAQLKN